MVKITALSENDLPITPIIPSIIKALEENGVAILVAPPGAGKTTLVPIELLNSSFIRSEGKILLLEPRRIAARAAASRMASMLGEVLGETIGLQTRFDAQYSKKTRILVATEGVFTRKILDDPSIAEFDAILFDEFHERSLDADFGLALALETKEALRPDLHILLMSATLDDDRISNFLGDAPILRGEGRAFPVKTIYKKRDYTKSIEDQIVNSIMQALSEYEGSILVFLPGQSEIERTRRFLEQKNIPENVEIATLYGNLSPKEQDRAIKPFPDGKRKIVLATSIAETSLTIEGVRIVIDSGLMRIPKFEPDLGITRLETVRVSKAAADQRRGRAGRTQEGIAIRLWEEEQDKGLIPFSPPEILSTDLTSFRLDCAIWGASPYEMRFIDPPPNSYLKIAESSLQEIGALDSSLKVTDHGKKLSSFPLSPTMASMILEGAKYGLAKETSILASMLSERGIGGNITNLEDRLRNFQKDNSHRATILKNMAINWEKIAINSTHKSSQELTLAALLAKIFPDRVAKSRGNGNYSQANGRLSMVEIDDVLAQSSYIIVLDSIGSATKSRITLGLPITREEIDLALKDKIIKDDLFLFDKNSKTLRKREIVRINKLTLEEKTLQIIPDENSALFLAKEIAALGIEHLQWPDKQKELLSRVRFLNKIAPDSWPDLSKEVLEKTIEEWLAPFLRKITSFAEIKNRILDEAMYALIPYNIKQKLDQEAPAYFQAPTGNSHPIIYEGENAPYLSIRVQELFGVKEHPSIANSKYKITLELLSPAHRPIQITQDLPGFWKGSWAETRAEMRGQYPKHFWPENPEDASPTTKTKNRMK